MDRSAFLSSLPFLEPISSSNNTKPWPPQDEETTAITISLAPESLSIEPSYSVLGHDDISAGPAFFRCNNSANDTNPRKDNVINDSTPITTNNKTDDDNNNKEYSNSNSVTDTSDLTKKDNIIEVKTTSDNNDPALCNIEISYIPWEKLYKKEQHTLFGISPKKSFMTSPGLSAISNNTSTLSYSFHNTTPSKFNTSEFNISQHQQQHYHPKLYFRFDKKLICSVDITQIMDITLDEPQTKTQPSSLLIKFEECTFRFFYSSNDKTKTHLQLQKVYMIFVRWLNGESSMEFLTSSSCNSPSKEENSGSSSSTSHEPGQRYYDVMQHCDKEKRAVTLSSLKGRNNGQEDVVLQKKRKLNHYKESWEAIQTLFSTNNSNIPKGISTSITEDDMHNLLDTSANSYTQSYFSSSKDEDWNMHEEEFKKQSLDKLTLLEKTIYTLFPTPNKTKLQLKAKNDEQQKQKQQEENKIVSIDSLEIIIKEYKDMVNIRHELACLPKR